MRKLSRIKNVVIGVVLILFALLLLIWPRFGTPLIMMVFGIGLLIYGLYSLIFFCRMAIHMVGGKRIFFRGILLLDLGIFLMSSFRGSERLVFLYMLVLLAASGAIDLVRALDYRKQGAAWLLRAVSGVVCIAILIAGLIYRRNPNTMVYIFCLALLFTAISRIVSAFRKTAVLYIPE